MAIRAQRGNVGVLLGWVAMVFCCVAVAWILVGLGRVSSAYQLIGAVVLGVVPLVVLVYAWRPHLLIVGYIFVIPLLVDASDQAALNAGEVTTLLVLFLGGPAILLHDKRLPSRLKGIILAFFGLALLGVISVVANSVTSIGDVANAVMKYAAFALLGMLVYIHIDTEHRARSLMSVILTAAVIVAVYSVFAYVTGRSYYPEYGFSRASGTFEHWNQLGGYMVMTLFPLFGYGLSRRRTWIYPACLAGIGILVLVMLLSLTIGSLVAAIGAVAIGLVVFFRRSLVGVIGFLLASLLVVAAVWQTVPAVREHFASAETRAEDRFSTYRVGLHLFRENLLFGVGGQDQVLEEVLRASGGPGLERITVVPHNALLAVGAEKGIFGVVVLLILLWCALRQVLNPVERYPHEFRYWHIGLALGSVALIIQSMSNLLVLHVRLGAIWVAMLALDARLAQFREQESPEDSRGRPTDEGSSLSIRREGEQP